MKKIILLAAFILSMSVASAQGLEWGAKAGVNLAWKTEYHAPMRHRGDFEGKNRVGFYAGVFAEKRFGGFFGLQGELLYSQMGNKSKADDTSYGFKTDYLALPILAKLYVWKGLSLDLGPQVGYLLSAKGLGEDSGHKLGHLRDFDAAFAVGLSYKLCGKFDISARCNIGLNEIGDGSSDARNAALALGVGYRF